MIMSIPANDNNNAIIILNSYTINVDDHKSIIFVSFFFSLNKYRNFGDPMVLSYINKSLLR